jgi:hypothetical protein
MKRRYRRQVGLLVKPEEESADPLDIVARKTAQPSCPARRPSPGSDPPGALRDAEEEREIVVRVIQEWNDLHSYNRKVVLLPLRWETHTAPEYGTNPKKS